MNLARPRLEYNRAEWMRIVKIRKKEKEMQLGGAATIINKQE